MRPKPVASPAVVTPPGWASRAGVSPRVLVPQALVPQALMPQAEEQASLWVQGLVWAVLLVPQVRKAAQVWGQVVLPASSRVVAAVVAVNHAASA